MPRLKHVLLVLASFGVAALLLSLLRTDTALVGALGSRDTAPLPRRLGDFTSPPPAAEPPHPLLLPTAAVSPPPPTTAAPAAKRSVASAKLWLTRKAAAVAAIAHAFDGYAAHAWGYDELRPLSRGGKNTFCGTGATIIDSLSTLWLANLTERFERGAAWALAHDYGGTLSNCNLFETNIRIVGGLLSAGALANRPELFKQAEVIVKKMLPSFGTAAGIPCNNFPGGASCGTANLAEIGTLQLEFVYLSQVTGNPEYARVAERVIRSLALARNSSGAGCELMGLYADSINTRDGSMNGCHASVGGGNDSFYEYLIKLWLLTERHPSFGQYRRMWDAHAEGALKHLVRCSGKGHLYVAGGGGTQLEHLACYFPGNLMLGDAVRYERVAAGITESCASMYSATRSRLGADGVTWAGNAALEACVDNAATHADAVGDGDMTVTGAANIQRPEAVEALFHMWHFTGDDYWRDVGWEMFQTMEAKTKVEGAGYASVVSVMADPVQLEDTQQSFFIAEELKYMLLLFSERNAVLDFDAWIFNTEAHPLPRFTPKFDSTLGEVCDGAPLVCAPAAADPAGR